MSLPGRALPTAWATALAGLALGLGLAALGLQEGLVAMTAAGAAALVGVPATVSLALRLRDGLGNRGLDRDRRLLRTEAHLLRLGALVTGAMAVVGARQAAPGPWALPAVGAAVLLLAGLWLLRRGQAGQSPALDLDLRRTRLPLELAALALAGVLLGQRFPWADAAAGLAVAARMFGAGWGLGKATTLEAACGGCGGGCGCG